MKTLQCIAIASMLFLLGACTTSNISSSAREQLSVEVTREVMVTRIVDVTRVVEVTTTPQPIAAKTSTPSIGGQNSSLITQNDLIGEWDVYFEAGGVIFDTSGTTPTTKRWVSIGTTKTFRSDGKVADTGLSNYKLEIVDGVQYLNIEQGQGFVMTYKIYRNGENIILERNANSRELLTKDKNFANPKPSAVQDASLPASSKVVTEQDLSGEWTYYNLSYSTETRNANSVATIFQTSIKSGTVFFENGRCIGGVCPNTGLAFSLKSINGIDYIELGDNTTIVFDKYREITSGEDGYYLSGGVNKDQIDKLSVDKLRKLVDFKPKILLSKNKNLNGKRVIYATVNAQNEVQTITPKK